MYLKLKQLKVPAELHIHGDAAAATTAPQSSRARLSGDHSTRAARNGLVSSPRYS